jgi:hypothetical protein
MIAFFRRFRKRLLSENKFSKYLIYAIGEIILVVIGILIALQINNWNEDQKNTTIEHQLLTQMKSDLQTNLKDVEFNLRIQDTAVMSANLLLSHMESTKPYHDSLARHFSKTFAWTHIVINQGSYETVKSKGVDIISNVILRDEILNLFEGKLDFVKKYENIIKSDIEYFRLNLGPTYFNQIEHIKIGENEQVETGKTIPKDYEKLRKDTTYRFHLHSILTENNLFKNKWNLNYYNDILKVMEMIDDELENAK